ncbi:hypothetical protein [Carnobacterium divergens]|uniref:hypothetical protein n=1 Tax=Carnobacterium divergens TaxID=2748 RepID=UPI0007F53C23|nr:hypothetical protein [Carnobacterium divergens]SBO18443.1 hypothetical protein CDIV41_40263 [Carnobacterium divergens]
MKIKKKYKIIMIASIVMALSLTVSLIIDERNYQEFLKKTKKEIIEGYEKGYPGEKFEIYSVEIVRGFFSRKEYFDLKNLNDGIEFRSAGLKDKKKDRYYLKKLEKEAKLEMEKRLEAVFLRPVLFSLNIGPSEKYYELGKSYFEMLDYCQQNQEVTDDFSLRIYVLTDEEKMDWTVERNKMYQVYQNIIVQYKDAIDDYYFLSISYVKPNVKTKEDQTNFTKNELLKKSFLDHRVEINSAEDIQLEDVD